VEMPKARHETDVLGAGHRPASFSFDSEDITFTWDPSVPPDGAILAVAPGNVKVALRPTVATRPTWLGKQHRHAVDVAVNGVDLYQRIWSDEQLPEASLRMVVHAAITAWGGLLTRFDAAAVGGEQRNAVVSARR
jgi:hypothetical protein